MAHPHGPTFLRPPDPQARVLRLPALDSGPRLHGFPVLLQSNFWPADPFGVEFDGVDVGGDCWERLLGTAEALAVADLVGGVDAPVVLGHGVLDVLPHLVDGAGGVLAAALNRGAGSGRSSARRLGGHGVGLWCEALIGFD